MPSLTMPRMTALPDGIKHLLRLDKFLKDFVLRDVSVALKHSGVTVDGLLLPGCVENNGGANGRWAYRASIVVRTENDDMEIDFLDVDVDATRA